jgi:site-specific DNA-methyltransferase (adenine-specific)
LSIQEHNAEAQAPTPYFINESGSFSLFEGDCLALIPRLGEARFDLIFADPPYFLSNGGVTCKGGKMVSVHKGDWDRSRGPEANHAFNLRWLEACQRALTPNGTLFVSGTHHTIYSLGFALQQLGFKILNDLTWNKPNPPPNLACRTFTHTTETILWAAKSEKSRYRFNYPDMKVENGGKQMKSLWTFTPPGNGEKRNGKHPTQKPLALLERILRAASQPGDQVLDPFNGSGTTGIAALKLGRRYVGLDIDPTYLALSAARYRELAQPAQSPAPLISAQR